MNRWIKRGILGIISLILLALATVAYGLWQAERKMQRRIEVPAYALAPATDAVSLERGRYLFNTRGCAECHGADGGGRRFINDGAMQVAGPNISPGSGSVVLQYRPADWERTIRHGVKPDGRPAIIMPSEDYNRLTDADLAALVGHVLHLPPVQGGAAVLQLPTPVRVLFGLGLIPDAASRIDHQLPPQQPVAEALSLEHGRYVANICIGCHGEKLSGGKIPSGPPDWPAAANLTPGEAGVMKQYPDFKAFAAMMRSGKRGNGTPIQVMPFDSLAQLNDTDLGALQLFLQSLPARPAGQR